MPLSYVLRAQSAPDRTTDFQGDFIEETIASVPLSGAHLQEDTRKIHHLLKNYFVAETTEQWISSIEKRANGWDDFDALLRHYSGEVNVSRRFPTADLLQEAQTYKSEREFPLNMFLDKMRKMFNIFRDEGEPMSHITKWRELFRRVQHPKLQDTVKAFEVIAELEGITYSEADNHLTDAVSNIPEYQFPRKVSRV